MNCQEFWNHTPENSAGGTPEWAAHLGQCQACASAWAVQRNLAAGLRQVAADWSRMEAPARVEARLVGAFREQAGLGSAPRPHAWIPALTWAAAGVAVLALAFSLIHVRPPQTVAPKQIPANAAILASAGANPEGSTYNPEGGTDLTGSSLDSGFIPLPNVEQLPANESGDLVRVELPRSAMMAVGLTVSPGRAEDPVQAEVMFGPDGVARAVRFLDGSF